MRKFVARTQQQHSRVLPPSSLLLLLLLSLVLLFVERADAYHCPLFMRNQTACTCDEYADGAIVRCTGPKGPLVVEELKKAKAEVRELVLSQANIIEIGPRAFNNLRLKRLVLNDNKIRLIQKNAFRGLEPTLQELSIANNRLTEVPTESLDGLRVLTTLSLRCNRIGNLSDGEPMFAGMPNLIEVNVGCNKICDVDAEAFKDVRGTMQNLILDQNCLQQFPTPAVVGMQSLIALHLKYNKIEQLPAGGLHNLSSLSMLTLTGNKIGTISPNFTVETPSLRFLYLGENDIGPALDPAAIKQFGQAEIIDLSYNRLTSVGVDTFAGMERLQHLNLEANAIKEVAPGAFSTTPLLLLWLPHNCLSSVAPNMFQGTPFLKQVSLAHNTIKEIQTFSFAHLANLHTLDLSHNRLKQLQPSAILGSDFLTVRVQENPFVCGQDGFHVMNGREAINLTNELNLVCKNGGIKDESGDASELTSCPTAPPKPGLKPCCQQQQQQHSEKQSHNKLEKKHDGATPSPPLQQQIQVGTDAPLEVNRRASSVAAASPATAATEDALSATTMRLLPSASSAAVGETMRTTDGGATSSSAAVAAAEAQTTDTLASANTSPPLNFVEVEPPMNVTAPIADDDSSEEVGTAEGGAEPPPAQSDAESPNIAADAPSTKSMTDQTQQQSSSTHAQTSVVKQQQTATTQQQQQQFVAAGPTTTSTLEQQQSAKLTPEERIERARSRARKLNMERFMRLSKRPPGVDNYPILSSLLHKRQKESVAKYGGVGSGSPKSVEGGSSDVTNNNFRGPPHARQQPDIVAPTMRRVASGDGDKVMVAAAATTTSESSQFETEPPTSTTAAPQSSSSAPSIPVRPASPYRIQMHNSKESSSGAAAAAPPTTPVVVNARPKKILPRQPYHHQHHRFSTAAISRHYALMKSIEANANPEPPASIAAGETSTTTVSDDTQPQQQKQQQRAALGDGASASDIGEFSNDARIVQVEKQEEEQSPPQRVEPQQQQAAAVMTEAVVASAPAATDDEQSPAKPPLAAVPAAPSPTIAAADEAPASPLAAVDDETSAVSGIDVPAAEAAPAEAANGVVEKKFSADVVKKQ